MMRYSRGDGNKSRWAENIVPVTGWKERTQGGQQVQSVFSSRNGLKPQAGRASPAGFGLKGPPVLEFGTRDLP